jgi:shikimate dehydrogenase
VVEHFAVVGNPINHSLSPIIHQYFARQVNIQLTYEKIRAEEPTFEKVLVDFFLQGGKGLNITLPFKQPAFFLAQQPTLRCQLARAANTLWMHQGQLYADNTDGIGLIRDLNRYIALKGARVLIVGAGGAARGIVHPLLEHDLKTLVVASRTTAKAVQWQQEFPQVPLRLLHEIKEAFDLIINATSASLNEEFISLHQICFSQKPFCYDLAYKQNSVPIFVHHARKLGCEAIDGLGMLVEQAAEAFFIWHKQMPETQSVLRCLRMTLNA